jgi:hypothetical protein
MVREENAALGVEREETNLLLQDHEMVLEKVMEGLRVYAVCHSSTSHKMQLSSEKKGGKLTILLMGWGEIA